VRTLSSLEPPSEVYYRQFDQIDGDFLSFGSQHPENLAFKKELARKAKSKSFDLMPLREIIIPRDETINTKKATPNELFSYLGLGDIESGTGNIIGYQELLGSNILSKSCVFYKGDIVFGRLRPYLNKVHLVQKEKAIGSSELYVITPNLEKVNPEFLLRYLISDLTLTQTKWILTGNSYPRLGIDDFMNLSIVLPDLKSGFQEKIASAVSDLETKALDSRTKYSTLMKEAYDIIPNLISIEIPQDRENDFYYTFPEECANRLDFNYNKSQYRKLVQVILKKTDEAYDFSVLMDPKSGLTNGIELRKFVEKGTPYLRVGDVAHYKLNINEVARVSLEADKVGKDIKLELGNLIISRSAVIGIVLLVDDKFPKDDIIIAGDLIRVKLKDEIDGKKIRPRYIEYYLKSEIGQMQFRRSSHGSTIPKVNHEGISEMKIILPSEQVQIDIESKISAKLKKAEDYEAKYLELWAESRKRFIDSLFG
jgi:restriction endonuclease S subunit